MTSPERCLFVYHPGALGDLILSLPALAALRTQHISAMHIATRVDLARFLVRTKIAEEASDAGSSRYSSLFDENSDSGQDLFFRRFSKAVVFSAKPESTAASALLTRIPDTSEILTIPPSGTPMHATAFRFSQTPGNFEKETPCSSLEIPPDQMQAAKQLLESLGLRKNQRLVILHPGSGGRKNWPSENFLALADALSDSGIFIAFAAGPAEPLTLKKRIADYAELRKGRVMLLDNLELEILAGIFRKSDLVVGNDSGVSHLAAACGAPTLTIFGPTDPVVWRPIGSCSKIVSSKAGCAPCEEAHRLCPDQICLSGISVAQIAEQCRLMLSEKS